MVIKVDFDLTMSILAYNLYRLLALDLERYEHLTAQSLYEKFILNEGDIIIDNESITVNLKKKRNLPLVLDQRFFLIVRMKPRLLYEFYQLAVMLEWLVMKKKQKLNQACL